ncbi:hypothetical protein [Kineococcus halophytocola]|uniref:hypothetical protein n=1 Tax=Kineococcus halophytocola TaxID=3234027 RepID=UPI00351A0544
MLAGRAVDHARERDEWGWFLEDARTGDYEQEISRGSGVYTVGPPEGTSWIRWAEWVEHRLTEVAADESTVYDLPPFLYCWRSCTAELDPGAEDLVRAALSTVEPPEGTSVRDYLVVEAPGTVGVVERPGEDPAHPHRTSTRWLGVVVERTDETRVLRVNAVDPQVDERFPEWGSRWPVLTAALGGWFSDAALGVDDPWYQQATMLESESDERLAELVREGRELLLLDDEDLWAFVSSAGSCVQPPHLRWWFEWMFWRIETFDWKRRA